MAKARREGTKPGFSTLHKLVFPGSVPDGHVIDHIDQNPLKNVVSNLRSVTRAFNQLNASRQRGFSGYQGVVPSNGRFQARFKNRHLGTFDTARQAKALRIVTVRREDGEELAALETDDDFTEQELQEAMRFKKKGRRARKLAERKCLQATKQGQLFVEG